MLWILLTVPIGLLLWGAWPRAVKGEDGYGDEFRGPAVIDSPCSTLRAGTFNIHGGRGRDGKRDVPRIASDLAGLDIVALQEVHDSWRAPHQLQGLVTFTGMAALNAPTRQRWFRRQRNNALLTKRPLGAWTRMRLVDHPGWRSDCRNLTVVELKLPEPLWVLFTHLNRKDGRDEQLAQVMHIFLRYSPAVLLGDLNIRREEPAISGYLDRGDIVDALGEALQDDSGDRIDWILCRGVTVTGAGIIDSGASDHPLYWCDIQL